MKPLYTSKESTLRGRVIKLFMNIKDKKIVIGLSFSALILIVLGFIIPIDVAAPAETRTIIDYTTQTYAAPSCFDQAEMTNNLQETTFSHALSLNYDAESSCSEEFFQDSGVPLFIAMVRGIGIGEVKWSEEDML